MYTKARYIKAQTQAELEPREKYGDFPPGLLF